MILLLGNGDGTFQGGPALYVAAEGGAIAAGDLNGDGAPDLAVADSPTTFDSSLLTILLNTGKAASSFKLAVSPASQTVSAGNSTNYTVTATSGNGFDSSVSLTCSGQPSGSTCTVSPASVVPTASGATATVTVTTSASTSVGTYALVVTGTSGKEQFTVKPALTVNAALFALEANPGSLTVDAGSSGTFTVTGTAINGFNGTVSLTCTGQPSGSSCTPNPASITPTSSGANSTVTVTTSASTPVGTYPLMVTGTSGSVQHSVTVSLTVQAFAISAPKSLTPSSVAPGQPATATVTVTPAGGFTGTVAFTCSLSPTSAPVPTCSFNPAQVQVTGSAPATTTLTVSTTGPTAVLARPKLRKRGSPIYAIVFPVFGLALVGMGFSSGGRRKRLLGVAIGSVLFAGLILHMACGGGGGRAGSTGTPAGNYTVTVTGSSGSTQHTTSLMLTVQ